MRMKKWKILAATLLLPVLAVAALAMWSETVYFNVYAETSELDWEIVPGSATWMDSCELSPGYDWNATFYPDRGSTQLDKDVACTTVETFSSDEDGDLDTMEITIHNAYPWYYTHVAFILHNNGEMPLKIWKLIIHREAGPQEYYIIEEEAVEVDVTGDGKPDVAIWWGDNFGYQMHPCENVDISLDITVLQDAPQGEDLCIMLELVAVQYNMYETPAPR